MKRTISERVKIYTNTDIEEKTANEKEILNKRQRDKRESAMKKWKIIQEVQRLYKEKKSVSEISRLMKITRQTIYVYLRQQQPLERTTNSILDPYIPMIKELIIKKQKVKEIYEEIKKEGYKGKKTLLKNHLKGIRQEVRMSIKYLKRSKIKKLLFYDLEQIKDENLRNDLIEYLEKNLEFKLLINIMKKFKEILFDKKPEKLEDWIIESKKHNINELNSFINLIERDKDAVKNAIIYDYSNGLTEGFNNKTKVIKRIMYGRCKFELLRLKILA